VFNSQTVVLITASSAGLGAAIARVFASHGARVIVNYYSSPQAWATLDNCYEDSVSRRFPLVLFGLSLLWWDLPWRWRRSLN